MAQRNPKPPPTAPPMLRHDETGSATLPARPRPIIAGTRRRGDTKPLNPSPRAQASTVYGHIVDEPAGGYSVTTTWPGRVGGF